MPPAIVLFDDRIARDWMPFTLTRPAGELRFGTCTLRERAERAFGLPCIAHIAAEHLRAFDEPGAPPVRDIASLPRDRDLLFLSSRAVPDWGAVPIRPGPGAEILAIAGEPCAWYAPAGSAHPAPGFLERPTDPPPGDAPVRAIPGRILERLWHLVTHSADQVAADIAARFPGRRDTVDPGVHLLGDAPLILGDGATVEPGAVIDLREGPVWLDDGARVVAFTRLAGPAYIGRDSTVLGGQVAGVSIGPRCKVHGELEETVVLGYTNKAHDGFIGHAYLGAWVNLGALTTNSDLKNNYGSVRMWTPAGVVDTGETKLGCLIGDHAKTAIGTLLNTGTVVGAGCNVFGPGSPSRYVQPFTWGTGDGAVEYALEKFLETAAIVMGRRNVELTDAQRRMLCDAWRFGRGRG